MRTVVAVLLLGFTACRTVAAPAIRFAPESTDPSQVRRDIPLTANERAALTPKNLQSLSQDQVNQIYARLTPGAIPDGPYNGDLFFPRDANHRARLRDVTVLPSAIAHLATVPVRGGVLPEGPRVVNAARAEFPPRGRTSARATATPRTRSAATTRGSSASAA